MAETVIVYRAQGEAFSLLESLRRFLHYRETLVTFVLRDLKVRYKQTLLGVLWAVIPPLMLMVVFNVIFSRFARMPSEGIPYPIFAYSALLPWTFFASSVAAGANSLTGNYGVISKIYFPREVLPWAAVLGSGADFLIGLVIFFALMVFYHVPPTAYALLLPPLLGIQLVYAGGIALIAAAFNVYYRDVRHGLPLLLQLWLYATPIVYPLSVVPAHLRLAYFAVNPMAGLIDSYRRVLVRGLAPDLVAVGVSAVVAFVTFAVCYRVFKRLEREFADVM
ncbi:MAG TPA: ABC transporter permease [bacterium]|nr:ABC transporter permease [bacterium]